MDELDEPTSENMVSNLPLLFANGYPTSLEKISEKALQNFIPFMVQCSLGNMKIQGRNCLSEPEWWPEDVPFSIPLKKPKKFNGNWQDKLKEIVLICYQFHKSVFLLRFCSLLAGYEPTLLRFINNYNSTTSLYDRSRNKLLVTFRNENMSYDKPQTNRKTLLKKTRSRKNENNNNTQQMVEPELFDIYLCDNCDAELYSLEAITEHEKTCTQDDDVIICDSPTPDDDQNTTNVLDKSNDERREDFLLNFGLQSRNIPKKQSSLDSNGAKEKESLTPLPTTSTPKPTYATRDSVERRTISVPCRRSARNVSNDTNAKNSSPPIEKPKRLPRPKRAGYVLSRTHSIPLSSPAGQFMIKSSNNVMTQVYIKERLDRMERLCGASVLLYDDERRPKFKERIFTSSWPPPPVSYKKPANANPTRFYTFPRRQFWNRYRAESFMFINSLLLKKCRPLSVRVERLQLSSFSMRGDRFLIPWDGSSRCSVRSSSISSNSTNVPHFAIADVRSMHQTKPSSGFVLDTIDLCSSDEDESDSINADSGSTTNETIVPMETSSSGLQSHIIGPEVTLTRVSKSLEHDMEPLRKKGRFEGNFLLSESCPTQPPKPLQPSVFLFSNYTSENIHLRHSTGNVNGINISNSSVNFVANGHRQSVPSPQNLPTLPNNLKAKTNDNQENVQRNGIHRSSTSALKNSSFNNIQNGGMNEWLPNLNSSASNYRTERSSSTTTTSNNNGKLISLYACTSGEEDVVLNKINSPNRTISIDLTI